MFYILWVNCDLVWIDGVKIKYNTIQYHNPSGDNQDLSFEASDHRFS